MINVNVKQKQLPPEGNKIPPRRTREGEQIPFTASGAYVPHREAGLPGTKSGANNPPTQNPAALPNDGG